MGAKGHYALELMCDEPGCFERHAGTGGSGLDTITSGRRLNVVSQDHQKALQEARKMGWQITSAVRCPVCADPTGRTA
jgi:hypothetical protein